ncbi:glycerophosphodiester phosphodiesterase family protein [Rhodococcoides yunnanense]|uniref:Glycerophosphodiester phosphodiesterase family protein n=1 Tax=Rhodococcoides yunnanense TaxID=278209 RepID=A0ABU4BJ23_9NOCA|nr:glycerophosphodiester phosphodiesterase family protein [Rhodococcus yunnanensis]MDV6264180.1 glycerophosphodiester phosphodiesterase family protein [Rhodococcus yunnanensis]
MMFGTPQYAQENATINSALALRRPLVAVHRGTGLGSIAENTQAAVVAAVRQGADMVEFDVVRSTDGEFFLFHDGYEALHFGFESKIGTLTAEQIRALRYRWNSDEPYGVTALSDVLTDHPDTLFNVDRSWWFWDTLLPYLDRFAIDGRVLLKCPVETTWLDMLAAHPVKYSLAPMARTHEEVLEVLARDDVNTIGIELIADRPDHVFATPDYTEWLHTQGKLVFLSALTMRSRDHLFCGWDDETSILRSPKFGWDRLTALDPDIIQTDWPGLLIGHLRSTAPYDSPSRSQ